MYYTVNKDLFLWAVRCWCLRGY